MARHGLTRDGIVGAAARVADAGGIGARLDSPSAPTRPT